MHTININISKKLSQISQLSIINAVIKGAVLCCGLISSFAFAQTINYDVFQVSATEYEYRYTLTNDSSDPISEFILFFDETLYSNLSEVSRPSGWDSLIVPPDPGLSAAGEYDAFVTGPTLAVGDSIGEFVIRFEWLGAGEPGDQPFAIIDPVTFATVFSGTTMPITPTNQPAPASIPSISFIGLISLLALFFMLGYSRLQRLGTIRPSN